MNSYFNPIIDMSEYNPPDVATNVRVAECLGLLAVARQETEASPVVWYTYAPGNEEDIKPLVNYSGILEETIKLINLLEEEIPEDSVEFYLLDSSGRKSVIIYLKNKDWWFTGFGRTRSIAFCNAWCEYQENKRK